MPCYIPLCANVLLTILITSIFSQDLLTLDVTKLTPLSPEVISRQATINIGTWGSGIA